MAKRLEKSIFDKLFNNKLLGKRKLGLPLKYNHEVVQVNKGGRFFDKVFFPKSKLDKLIGDIYERCLPGIQYLFWNEHVYWAREYGYTLQERLYHTWFRSPNVQLHAMAQTIHPWGYLEGQRRDAFIRRVHTMLPGIQAPDWAQQNRRAHDMDYNSIDVPLQAMEDVIKEATPTQHINYYQYFAFQQFFNQRNQVGYSAQRLFYNEDLRGDYYRNGYLTKNDKQIIHSWYANSQADSQVDRINNMSETERADFEKNLERWNKNIEQFFPETKNYISNPVVHKYKEEYYERNMFDIRSAIFTSKWLETVEKFSGEEIQKIHEFFLNDNTEAFFTQENADEEAKPTELYTKFVTLLDFPDISKLDRFTTYTPEQQFYDAMDKNWQINFNTVDRYRALYIGFIKNNPNSEAGSLVAEELYNPLFKKLLFEKFRFNVPEDQSHVVKALENGSSIEDLSAIAKGARENVALASTEVLKKMVDSQVRKIVRTFTWKGVPQ